MRLRLFSDDIYREYRDELDAAAEASGFRPTHADTLLNAPTDAADGRHNLDAYGLSQAVVRDGRVVSVIQGGGDCGLEVMGWAVEEARRQRAETVGEGET